MSENVGKVWLTTELLPLIANYKGQTGIIADSKAIRQLITIGLDSKPTGKYAKILSESGHTVTTLESKSVRFSDDVEKRYRSYTGHNSIPLYQALYDLVCVGLVSYAGDDSFEIPVPASPPEGGRKKKNGGS